MKFDDFYFTGNFGNHPKFCADILPGIDLAIFRLPAAHSEGTDEALHRAIRDLIESAVESGGELGVWMMEYASFIIFAWRSFHRSVVLAELGVRELVGEPH